MGAYFQGGLTFQLPFARVKDLQGPRGLIFKGGLFSRGAYYSEFTVLELVLLLRSVYIQKMYSLGLAAEPVSILTHRVRYKNSAFRALVVKGLKTNLIY